MRERERDGKEQGTDHRKKYLGKRLVKASLAEGHETYILQREDMGMDIEKVQMLLSFKEDGAHLVLASFDDHRSLVEAVRLVDVCVIYMLSILLGL